MEIIKIILTINSQDQFYIIVRTVSVPRPLFTVELSNYAFSGNPYIYIYSENIGIKGHARYQRVMAKVALNYCAHAIFSSYQLI